MSCVIHMCTRKTELETWLLTLIHVRETGVIQLWEIHLSYYFRNSWLTGLFKSWLIYVSVMTKKASDRTDLRQLSIVSLTATTVLSSRCRYLSVRPPDNNCDQIKSKDLLRSHSAAFLCSSLSYLLSDCVLPARPTCPSAQAGKKKPEEWPTRR